MEINQLGNPEVTVVMPTFNRAHLITRAIKSVLNQSFQNWELVICDDGSRDNTSEIVKSFQNDPRIVYIKLNENVGPCKARNLGIKKAAGKFIAFLDSDDEWLPRKLEKQLAVFNNVVSSPLTGLVYTSAFFIDSITGESRIRYARERGHIFEVVLTTNPIGGPSRVMVRKECLDRVGYFDSDFVALEDWELWTRIAEKYSIDIVNESLVNYFEGYSDSVSVNTDKLVMGYEAFWRKHKVTAEKKNILKIHYAKLGHRLCYYDDTRRGRGYLRKALLINWWNPVYVILLGLSFMGNNFYRQFTFLFLKFKE